MPVARVERIYMIIVMHAPTGQQIKQVLEVLRCLGIEGHIIECFDRTIITAEGEALQQNRLHFSGLPGVESVLFITTPFKLVSRQFRAKTSVVSVRNAAFGNTSIPIIAGPCAIESYEQLYETAAAIKKAGACILRAGTYKPRTSPYSFQGLEREGLAILQAVSRELDIPVVSEVTDPRLVDVFCQSVDILQIGARNMQNFALLKEVAQSNKPVLLKRGPASTVEEWLLAAEYVLAGGNSQIILCERGIRTFEPYTRNTLDLNAMALAKELSHLPVIVDPSHGTGQWSLVGPMSKAAIAAGADGLVIEVHPCPAKALSDGPQSLTPQRFAALMDELRLLANVLNRQI